MKKVLGSFLLNSIYQEIFKDIFQSSDLFVNLRHCGWVGRVSAAHMIFYVEIEHSKTAV